MIAVPIASTSGVAMPTRGHRNLPPSRAGDGYTVAVVVVAAIAVALGVVALILW